MQIQEDGRGCHWQIDGFFQKVKCIGKDHLLVQCCCLTGETRFTNSHGEKEIGQKTKSCCCNDIHVGEVGRFPKWLRYLWAPSQDGETRFPSSHGEKEIGQKRKSCDCNAIIHFGEVGGSPKWFWYLWTPSQDGGIAELQLDMISSKIENLKENRKSSWLRYVAKFSYFFPK